MTKIVVRNLVKGPSTIRYPAEPAKKFEGTRGVLEIDIDKCIFCGLCSRHCPSDAINISKNDRLWEIDRARCISCNSCVEACPKDCLVLNNTYHEAFVSGPVVDSFTGPEIPDSD